jgi:thiol-disulfide isomerase/thioredoxin
METRPQTVDRPEPEEDMNHELITRRRIAMLATPFAAALLVAGCSSSSGTDAMSEGASPADSAQASTPTASASGSGAMEEKGSGAMEEKGSDAMEEKGADAMAAPAGYIEYSDYASDSSKYAASDVVLFFNAGWCPTCMEADKQLNSTKFPDGLVVVSVDYDDSDDLKQQYGVTTQHTFVQVDPDGNELAKFTGSTTVDEIEQQLA